MKTLQHSYIKVSAPDRILYGGSQSESPDTWFRKSACGIISASDLLLYIGKTRPELRGNLWLSAAGENAAVDLEEYLKYAGKIRRRYVPILPGFGTNGVSLAIGLNLYFLRNRLPLVSWWGIRPSRMEARIQKMLDEDIPIVLAVGPNFPLFWGKHTVNLYVRDSQKRYRKSTSVKAHFMNVTGMDETWFRVSSWGKEYYINREEYHEYRKRYSNALLSGILVVTPFGKAKKQQN